MENERGLNEKGVMVSMQCAHVYPSMGSSCSVGPCSSFTSWATTLITTAFQNIFMYLPLFSDGFPANHSWMLQGGGFAFTSPPVAHYA